MEKNMKFTFTHFNFNVLNLEKTLAFYSEALGLVEKYRKENIDFTLVFLTDNVTNFTLELTHIKNRELKYDLGETEFHLAFYVDNYEQSYKKHKEMGIICFENEKMGVYFIEDPDGYWIEITPEGK
jgi:lactoylglutathione lyase